MRKKTSRVEWSTTLVNKVVMFVFRQKTWFGDGIVLFEVERDYLNLKVSNRTTLELYFDAFFNRALLARQVPRLKRLLYFLPLENSGNLGSSYSTSSFVDRHRVLASFA